MKASESNSEWITRKRLIDPKLKAAGWKVVPFAPGAPVSAYPTFLVAALRSLQLSALDTSTAIPGLNRDDVYEQTVFLPPLAEQERLASQLDRCFSLVDSARDHLSRVPAILKHFRQAVLAAAYSGRLGDHALRAHQID